MAANKYVVTVGPRAYSFNDQSTGISIAKGQKKELSSRQYLSKKIQRALAAGHLVMVVDQSKVTKYTDQEIEKMDKKLMAQIAKGMESSKIAKGYSLEEAKLLANRHNLEADSSDTVQSLIEAIMETESTE